MVIFTSLVYKIGRLHLQKFKSQRCNVYIESTLFRNKCVNVFKQPQIMRITGKRTNLHTVYMYMLIVRTLIKKSSGINEN